ncbi:MAG: protein-L-isoaspartate O-methyltransferase [Burkholderiales bacterium]|nr:protein-L-isoaspartate O-methyltransferase [Burkholderiales bacterium]
MDFELARFNMVEQQVRPWRVFDENVMKLLGTIKREDFVQPVYRNLALSDIEVPLPGQQKMLFPKIEARLLQELKLSKKDKVLEIGTGSGYVTALLAKLTDFVYSVESDLENKKFAVNNLTKTGIKNVSVIEGDGSFGLDAKAPFDKIFIGGGIELINDSFKRQLKVGGLLVAIVGNSIIKEAILLEKVSENEFIETKLFETFVEQLVNNTHKSFTL